MENSDSHDSITLPLQVSLVHEFSDIVCPLSKEKLYISSDKQWLYAVSSQKAYCVKNHIPIMLPSEARAITESENAVLKSYPIKHS